jgi:hypothetical protein
VIIKAYHFCHRNQVQVARLLGVTRNVLRGRLASLGIISGRNSRLADREDRQGPPLQAHALDSRR